MKKACSIKDGERKCMLRHFCPSSIVICEHGCQYVEGLGVISLPLFGSDLFSGQLVISHKVPWECGNVGIFPLQPFASPLFCAINISDARHLPPPPTYNRIFSFHPLSLRYSSTLPDIWRSLHCPCK